MKKAKVNLLEIRKSSEVLLDLLDGASTKELEKHCIMKLVDDALWDDEVGLQLVFQPSRKRR